MNALQFGLSMGYGHHIPLSKKVVLVPEISASIPFSRIIAGPEWNQTSILIGVSIRWGMGAVKEEVIVSTPVAMPAKVIEPVTSCTKKNVANAIIE